MISVTGVSLGFGGQRVLTNVTFSLHKRAAGALVGANGSGKTSLLRILAGTGKPDAGTVSIPRSATVAYLPQQTQLRSEATVFDVAQEGYGHETRLAQKREHLASHLESNPDDASTLNTVAEIDQTLEQREYHHRHVHIHRVLRGLGFSETAISTPTGQLSGGWAMRAALARTLLSRPDVLLLDEPTNYLDSESRLWLSRFLNDFSGAFLLVSHDRAFLDDTVTEIFELFQGEVKRYRGSFTEYESIRSQELKLLIKRWEEQQKETARQEQFIRRFRAQANKARQVQSRIRMLEKTEPVEIPDHLRPITISIPDPPRSAQVVFETEKISRRYGDNTVLRNISISLDRGRRLAVVGRNGAGKTTLLRILSGGDTDYSGSLVYGSSVATGYFAQDTPEKLPSGITVLDYLEQAATGETLPRVRDILGAFLFSGDAVEKNLEVLSGGERTRLALATLLVRPVNVLILDEPTNHLDMTSQSVLARALSRYKGTVVFVSHDRHFLRTLATDVLALWGDTTAIPDGWRLFPGSYSEFEQSELGMLFDAPEEKHGSRNGNSRSSLGDRSCNEDGDTGGAHRYEQQKARKSELRRLQQEEERLLAKLEQLEERQQSIQELLTRHEVYSDGEAVQRHTSDLAKLEEEIEDLHQSWEETHTRLQQI